MLGGAALCALVVASASAQPPRGRKHAPAGTGNVTVIYRCTDAGGMLSIQNVPCPRGQHQERSVLAKPVDPAPGTPPSAPSAVTPTVTVVAPASPPESGSVPASASTAAPAPALAPREDGSPLPPPPLYRCHTSANGSYLSETDTPPERCRPIALVNISGNASVPANGPQCEMERDRCERIPDQDVCAGWQQRLNEARSMLELGNPDLVERATLQRDQAQRVVDRTCLTSN